MPVGFPVRVRRAFEYLGDCGAAGLDAGGDPGEREAGGGVEGVSAPQGQAGRAVGGELCREGAAGGV